MKKRRKGMLILLAFFSMAHPFLAAAAQSYDLKEMTPAVEQAIEGRKARFGVLHGFKQQGIVGEGNHGFAEVLGASLEAVPIIQAENQDRLVIYKAIVEQNGLGPSGYDDIQKVFAEVQRGKAQPGELIQRPSGEWVKK